MDPRSPRARGSRESYVLAGAPGVPRMCPGRRRNPAGIAVPSANGVAKAHQRREIRRIP